MLLNKKIKYLIVHCSDTSNNLSAIDIHKMHLSFGWDGIGYHKVVLRNGKVENGRPEYWTGAHVKGINSKSLGICLIGRDKFTAKQLKSLAQVLKKWKSKYPNATIAGHCDVVKTHKTCPNFDVISWSQKLKL